MNKKAVLIGGVILIALVAGGVFLLSQNKKAGTRTTATKALYHCPMHKEYISDKPGNCPICSMKLVKKEGSDEEAMKKMIQENQVTHSETSQTTNTEAAAATGAVFISPERQQMLGVRSVPAEYKTISREVRTVGKIAYDETRITHIHTRFNGWIEHVFVDFVGEPVRKGQQLFTIYSPELVSTQEEYLLALRSREKLGGSSFDWISKGSNTLADSAKERLKLWGVSEAEIEEVRKTGKARRTVPVYSPVNGIVTQRAAYHHGTYITPEMEIYTIVDISTVWLVADISEKDLPFVKTGQMLTIEFPYSNGKRIDSRIEFFYPYLDPATRTGQVRVQLKNPGNQFKLDQFVNVFVRMEEQKNLVVPSDAVLNTGEKQYVFIDLGDGYFDPRQLRIGVQTAEETSIEEGLKEGERVVTAANFLLDSEARLRGVLENMGKPKQPTETIAQPKTKLNIQILQPKTAKTGDNEFKVSVKDASGNPITGSEVEVTIFMPQMGNMPPMTSKGVLLDQGNGIYAGTLSVPMAWTWETTISVRKDGNVLGSIKTTVTAR